ncbi:MAG: SDR family oxidoreductase [Aquificae bacterium]|nr:SDR family oxidoreductase [Aquificota bacterium]
MGKVVLLTGVRRIGKALALELLRRGYRVAAVYRSSLPKELEGKVLAVKADLSKETGVKAVEAVKERFGRLDAFVHLASPYEELPLERVTPEMLEGYFNAVTRSFFFITVEAAKLMSKNEGAVKGRVVAFGDWAVDCPYRGYAPYFVAKAALHGAVKVLAKELAPSVLVNGIALGPVLKAEQYDEEKWERVIRRTPIGRPVPLKEVVKLTLFLLETEGTTGELVRLDGGRHLAGPGA